MADQESRQFDLIVHGATSFVGQILCQYLVERHGTDGALRWAVSGRDADKLARVAAETGADVPQFIVDSMDREQLDELVARTSVIVSTVGPFALYGSDLVRAAVAAGTDYCDSTGETQWVRRMIDESADVAAATGARVLHCCGFDSIPSDLGVWFTQQHAIASFGQPCQQLTMYLVGMSGGASGGTLASMVNLLDEAASDATVREVLANHYSLCPPGERSGVPQPSTAMPSHERPVGKWVAPFVMDAINTRIVHRSNALLGYPWGRDFIYDERMSTGSGPLGAMKAGVVSAGIAGGSALMAVGPLRRFVSQRLLPKPGTGPSVEAQSKGYFNIEFHGVTSDGNRVATRVTGDRDPGYGSTARMLGEVADSLVRLDRATLPGGSWTTASAFGDALVTRLVAHAGLTFEVIAV